VKEYSVNFATNTPTFVSMKPKLTSFLFTLLMMFSLCGWAQTPDDSIPATDWDSFVETFLEIDDKNALEESWDEEMLEDLYEIYCEKINLNNLTNGRKAL
jgi:hypothetical protein